MKRNPTLFECHEWLSLGFVLPKPPTLNACKEVEMPHLTYRFPPPGIPFVAVGKKGDDLVAVLMRQDIRVSCTFKGAAPMGLSPA